MANKPVVFVQLQFRQFDVFQFTNVTLPRLRFTVGNLENAPCVFAGVAGVMTFACVGEVTHEHPAIRPIGESHPDEPRVGRSHHVRGMAGGITAVPACQPVVINAAAVDVVHEHIPSVFIRPVVAEIDHRAAVRVAAADQILLRSADACADGFRVRKMQVIRNRLDAFI